MKTYTCLEFCKRYGITVNPDGAKWYVIFLSQRWPRLIRTWVGFDGRRLVEVVK